MNAGHISACCQGKCKTAGGKDGRRWSFCFDAEAAQPALLKGEEWKDVVAGHGLHEVDVTGIKGITGQTEGQVDIAQVREEVKKRGMTWPQVSSLGRFKDSQGIIACCLGKIKTAGGKDGGRWCFCFDTEAGEPEHIEGEEWRDVVMAGV